MLWLGSLVRWWRDRHRRIFRFTAGDEVRWGDPLRLCAAVEDACPDLDDLLDAGDVPALPAALPGRLGGEMRDRRAAANRELVRVARQVFGLPGFDGSAGVTDAEAAATLRRLLAWLDGCGEDARPFYAVAVAYGVLPGPVTPRVLCGLYHLRRYARREREAAAARAALAAARHRE